MNVMDKVGFASNNYIDLNWSRVIQKLSNNYKINGLPCYIARGGWVIMPIDAVNYDSIAIISQKEIILESNECLTIKKNPFLESRNLIACQFKQAIGSSKDASNTYYAYCVDILREALSIAKNMTEYTYDHIANREADGVKLIQNELIQDQFAHVFSGLSIVSVSLNDTGDGIEYLYTVAYNLINALHNLARITGGRAVLLGNVVELINHLFIYQQLYLSSCDTSISEVNLHKVTDLYISPGIRYGKEFGEDIKFLRGIAMEVDEDPDCLLQHLDNSTVYKLLTDKSSTAVERTTYLEAYSYGDPGAMMACPGPSLSGLMIRELGTENQLNTFYEYLENNRARTFFALTEPSKGSDAGRLECSLVPDPDNQGAYILNGEKCLFGNGSKGEIGVILARTNAGPLGIRAVVITPDLLDPDAGYIDREILPTTGLKGAQIGWMRFNNCPISAENILGQHKSPMERGMMAVIKTFNRLRTGVGALAIGQAQAVLDDFYVNNKFINVQQLDKYINLSHKLNIARKSLMVAAHKVDDKPFDTCDISISKVEATTVAEYVIRSVISMQKPETMLENQWLAKCFRDSFSWEYMEGTRNMQHKNIFQALKVSMLQKTSGAVVAFKDASVR